MKSTALLFAVLVGTFSFSHVFALDNTTQPSTASSNNQTQNASQSNDGQIIEWLIILNNNEIKAADLANTKNVSPAVKSYSDMLKKDHTKNLRDTEKLSQKTSINPVSSSESTALEQAGKDTGAKLSPLNNSKFQVDYLDAMVKGHSEALNKIDQDLNTVSNPELKKHLEKTRKSVLKHLNTAKSLQSKQNYNS